LKLNLKICKSGTGPNGIISVNITKNNGLTCKPIHYKIKIMNYDSIEQVQCFAFIECKLTNWEEEDMI